MAQVYYEEGETEVYSGTYRRNGEVRFREGYFWRFIHGKKEYGPFHTADEAERAASANTDTINNTDRSE